MEISSSMESEELATYTYGYLFDSVHLTQFTLTQIAPDSVSSDSETFV